MNICIYTVLGIHIKTSEGTPCLGSTLTLNNKNKNI
jgi:hypothetical protein